eukprot:COSAG06_NODE_2691_length_6430_cov_2.427648_8_plen_61_part_00
MSGVHASRVLESVALRSVRAGPGHASARGRGPEIAWVYGGNEPPQPGDGACTAYLVQAPA